ncbi:MAG: Chloroplast import component protein (Tic20) [candidate division WS2 bacterium ADurb.Bin280]|uniref:Chloroplast import component protein (Tic20) n=1 Tax=candidate division WS2 bacterium ADurb.Bin280 TaxID=1852829 RepID=A0A1V5SDR2_9BACT|nr:MAG: Chloroplast import component protein (Tic20) [candidate division WS2 bacterium ADurb.Bin280]
MAEEAKTKNVGMGVLCYLGILVLIPLLTEAKNDPFVKFHIKQGLVLLIFAVIINVVLAIPVLGWIIGAIGWIISVYLMIVGIINVVNGEEKQLPILGQYGENFKI